MIIASVLHVYDMPYMRNLIPKWTCLLHIRVLVDMYTQVSKQCNIILFNFILSRGGPVIPVSTEARQLTKHNITPAAYTADVV